MTKYLIILSSFIFLFSCKQKEFDIASVSFPFLKDSLPKNVTFKEDRFFKGYVLYNSKASEIMYFDDLSIAGSLNSNKKSFFVANYVSFCESIEDKTIDKYEINISTTEQTLQFEKLLEKKFGHTDFYYRNSKFSYRIWEKDGMAYFFETNHTGTYNKRPFVSCHLYVVNMNNKELYNYRIADGFQYYGDYLFEKNKDIHKNKTFTYKDFIEQERKEAEEWGNHCYFCEDYVE
ncbi:hypothetical protein [Tenacibaculum sp. M341]|uniref:hypothetical protein n=1 Tax=Tenacibaculum sp. M341 TaxID=2530339 RepID=UPI00104A3EAD|nr:hypothetical protein [Tenacibaculum sp. M341]TCI91340.1 hypothetical protein EYW44_10310 [Tenacibaculum sp. M341]